MRPIFLLLLVVSFTLPSGVTRAQSHGPLEALVRLPSSARAAGMGGATGFARRRDASVFMDHPAGLVGASGVSTSAYRLDDAGSGASVSTATAWWGGHLGIGVRALSAGGHALGVSTAYGREVVGLRTAIVVTLVDVASDMDQATLVTFGAGVARGIGPITVALSGRHFGAAWSLDGANHQSPWDVGMELSTADFEVGPLDAAAATGIRREEGGAWIPSVGIELSYWPVNGRTFAVRGGITRDALRDRAVPTFGAAYTGDSLTFEYAHQADGGPAAGHTLGIVWR